MRSLTTALLLFLLLSCSPLAQGRPSYLAISAGKEHSCALTKDGSAYCWGWNFYGELGDGTTDMAVAPIKVKGVAGAVEISAGGDAEGAHSCARLENGSIECWGSNGHGQLGNGSLTRSVSAQKVTGIDNATQISAGSSHSCALLSSSQIKCWGSNASGQLGDGTTTQSNAPVLVPGLEGVLQISAGGGDNATGQSCALLASGLVKCWGDNSSGQLGDGSLVSSSTPVTVSGITTARKITTAGNHSCAVLSSGIVSCWGGGANGQLGNGTSDNQTLATAVSNINNASNISAGLLHSCALLGSGAIKCWGQDLLGQLGNGGLFGDQDSLTPASVSQIHSATAISSGGQHSCALLKNTKIACWGSSSNGQLGAGVIGFGSQATPLTVISESITTTLMTFAEVYSARSVLVYVVCLGRAKKKCQGSLLLKTVGRNARILAQANYRLARDDLKNINLRPSSIALKGLPQTGKISATIVLRDKHSSLALKQTIFLRR